MHLLSLPEQTEEEKVTLSQSEITLRRQISAFLSNPSTELLIIPPRCSPSLWVALSLTLTRSIHPTPAFHFWSCFMCHL